MLTIHQPTIEDGVLGARQTARFDEDGARGVLWFDVPEAYRASLCHERADAFLVGLLVRALAAGHDMRVLAPVSARLYYTLTHYLVPVLCRLRADFRPASITCDALDDGHLPTAGAVGTGVSCGIDSFYTIAEHLGDTIPAAYRLTHLTFFNVGSHGRTADGAPALFRRRLERVRPFAEESGLPLVALESNLGDLLDGAFQSTCTFSTLAGVLALQKLFGAYLFSSGTSIYDFHLDWETSGKYDAYTLPLLAGNDLALFLAGTARYRTEKTARVADYPPSYRYLNVCVTEADNCSACDKCLRTLLTLDILGVLERYRAVFDLAVYARLRDRYIAGVLVESSHDTTLRDIVRLMEARRFPIPAASARLARTLSFRRALGRLPLVRGLYRALTGRE